MNYLSEFEKQKAKRNELIKNSQQIYYLQTKKEKINVDAKKYVVLDVETNGLSSRYPNNIWKNNLWCFRSW